jgi:hypothetical protein
MKQILGVPCFRSVTRSDTAWTEMSVALALALVLAGLYARSSAWSHFNKK